MDYLQSTILKESFYIRPDVVQIAKDLLGKILITRFDNQLTSGMITETEAYAGISDKASHAYGGRRTSRTNFMYSKGGVAYVYLCYGIHSLFNVVTNVEGIPHAVLIRALKPLKGIEVMLQRSNKTHLTRNMGTGPGRLSRILGIHYTHTGQKITAAKNQNSLKILIADQGIDLNDFLIVSTPRIGVDYAEEDAKLPYRFLLKQKIPDA
jgi:DNA-3-methyladenine glycosylase